MRYSFFNYMIILCSVCFISFGCGSQKSSYKVSKEDMQSISQIVNMSGQDLTPAQIQRITKDIQKDPASKEAIEKILFGQKEQVIKYSPKTGKHYSGDLEFDPETGVKLEILPE